MFFFTGMSRFILEKGYVGLSERERYIERQKIYRVMSTRLNLGSPLREEPIQKDV